MKNRESVTYPKITQILRRGVKTKIHFFLAQFFSPTSSWEHIASPPHPEISTSTGNGNYLNLWTFIREF